MQIQEMQSMYSQFAPLAEIPVDEKPSKRIRVRPDFHQETADRAESPTKSPVSRFSAPSIEKPVADSKRVKVKINDSQRPIIAVIDSKTNEVIREVPPEQILDMLDALNSDLGTFLDREA